MGPLLVSGDTGQKTDRGAQLSSGLMKTRDVGKRNCRLVFGR